MRNIGYRCSATDRGKNLPLSEIFFLTLSVLNLRNVQSEWPGSSRPRYRAKAYCCTLLGLQCLKGWDAWGCASA